MTTLKKALISSNNIPRDSALWNMTGSMIMAFQSVIMLMILTRTINLTEAGVFTIAYANANLFLTIGKYGIRNYQVSDVDEEYSFITYRRFRTITVLLMLLVSAVYVVIYGKIHSYTVDKSLTVLWMCLFKAIDAYEDVYHGHYQQHNRLDIAGKCLTVRMVLTVVIFGLGIIMLRNLLYALMITTVLSALIFALLNHLCYPEFKPQIKAVRADEKIRNMAIACTPLFIGTFLAFYIGNAPKYAIDSVLNDELQACYGFIAMPVFVIGLLNNFIFNPIIRKLSGFWAEGDNNRFLRIIIRQVAIIAGITAVCVTGAWLIGIPVLSVMYNTDLSAYKTDLLILLVGGGFLSLSGLLVTGITIMRRHQYLMIGYIAVSLAAAIFSKPVVLAYSIRGAALLYTGLMALLCVFFAIILTVAMNRRQMPGRAIDQ